MAVLITEMTLNELYTNIKVDKRSYDLTGKPYPITLKIKIALYIARGGKRNV